MLDSVALEGRSAASAEFNLLRDRARELTQAVRDVERRRDLAAEAARAASDELAGLERQRSAGEDVVAGITKAEKRLIVARAEAAEPWAERVAGASAAARGAVADATRFATANYDALRSELVEDGYEAKTRADEALAALGDVYRARSAVSQSATALAALLGMRGRDIVPESRLGQIVRQADHLLMADGESAPVSRAPIAEAVA